MRPVSQDLDMPSENPLNQTRPSGADFLPDFCAGPAVFVVLFITEVVAILLTLTIGEAGHILWENLLWFSIYLQWIGLCSAAGLCMLRRTLHHVSGLMVALLAYGMLLVITGLITEVAFYLREAFLLPLAFRITHAEFMIRSLGVCAVTSALALRYFWLQHQWRRETLAAGQARYELLQARIRPHFLFNSLNSIAELAASQPQAAESAVEDLATLFRANLSEANELVSLTQELELCRAYLRMEQLRLGDRIQTDWDIADHSGQVPLPPLILQPLIENAVRHGIECLPQGGHIKISSRLSRQQLHLTVENPTGELQQPGTGEALENIRQRLHWLYGDRAELRINATNDRFTADILLPLSEPPA